MAEAGGGDAIPAIKAMARKRTAKRCR